MKIPIRFIQGVFVVLLLSGILLFNRLSTNDKKSNEFEEINTFDLETRINNNESIVVYYGSEYCSACKVFSPILKKAADNLKVKIYYLDADANEEFADKYNLYVAPALLFFKNKTITRHEGSMEQKETENILLEWRDKE